MFYRIFLTAALLLSSPLVLASNPQPFDNLIQQAPIQGQFIEKSGKDVSSGIVTLGKDGELRWERQKPYEELLISNKTQAWHVQPDLHQALLIDVRAIRSWQALMDPSMLIKYYQATLNSEGVVSLRRQPQVSSEQWPNMDIFLDPKGQLSKITFVDDDERTIEFLDWGPAHSVEFDYTPPPGMDVIGGP